MNILTFDIEDWWVYENYSIENKTDYLPRLNRYLDQILNLLEEKEIQATFFCLGEVAANYPEVIKSIANKGHQIGCHSFSHRFLGDAKPNEVESDTRKALDTIENVIGKKVTAYRAPAFSIMKNNNWVLEILAQNGIKYDSSIIPGNRSFGGYPDFPQKKPCIIKHANFTIKEFPIPTTSIFGKELAYSGGGYFRLFPYSKIKAIIKNDNYVMTYFHIKDFDKEQKRKYGSLEGEPALMRYFKDYFGLNNNFSKFKKLISDFEFVNIKQADEIINWENVPIVTI